ncbi:MAG TPA: hypothetical protein VFB21_12210 [Chthonomonadaceae bacterium]|nr:hypothetical protein [Chthonomonadaceae bacterium]
MKQAEFEAKFNALWQEKYAQYDETGKDHQVLLKEWRERAKDSSARIHWKLVLLRYARDVQAIGISRRTKNKAQALFDELGIDPLQLEFEDASGK